MDHAFVQSSYFTDPNGIALGASYWVTEPTCRPADYTDGEMFLDADPVPAVRELMATGELASIPPPTVSYTHLTPPTIYTV